MKHLDDKKRLSASRQMREHLATLMERVIENDAQRMKEKYSNDEFVTSYNGCREIKTSDRKQYLVTQNIVLMVLIYEYDFIHW